MGKESGESGEEGAHFVKAIKRVEGTGVEGRDVQLEG